MKNPIETPKESPNNQPFVTRIYTTKGDLSETAIYTPNVRHNKRVGVEINSMIHWLDKTFGTMDELEQILVKRTELGNKIKKDFMLQVGIDQRGLFRNLRDGANYLDKKITKIYEHFEHLKPSYMKRSLPVSGDNYLWSIEQLRDKYYR